MRYINPRLTLTLLWTLVILIITDQWVLVSFFALMLLIGWQEKKTLANFPEGSVPQRKRVKTGKLRSTGQLVVELEMMNVDCGWRWDRPGSWWLSWRWWMLIVIDRWTFRRWWRGRCWTLQWDTCTHACWRRGKPRHSSVQVRSRPSQECKDQHRLTRDLDLLTFWPRIYGFHDYDWAGSLIFVLDDRRQRAKQYWPIRWASSKIQ